MKRLLFLALLLPLAVSAQDGFTLKGKVGSLNSPAKVFLHYRLGNTQVTDSATLTNGDFEFHGSVNEPIAANLFLKHPADALNSRRRTRPDIFTIYLENKELTLSSTDSISNAIIKGSTLNEENAKLNTLLKPAVAKVDALQAEYSRKSYAEQRNPENRKIFKDRSDLIKTEMDSLTYQFIAAHPASFVSLEVFKKMIGRTIDPATAEPVFKKFSGSLKRTTLGQRLAEEISLAKIAQVGTMAKNFTQQDPDGKPVKLTDFKGKYVLIDFWASWCGPCRRENPNLVKAYNKYKEQNFTVLGVSLDRKDGRMAWRKAIYDDNLTWTQVSDLQYFDNEVAVMYGIRSIPSNVLIDPSGKIVAKNLIGKRLEDKLAELLGAGAVNPQ
jgi:peroxiredoxin